MRLHFFNAAVMYQKNRTHPYMRQLDPRVRRYIRKETRRRESLKLSKKEDDAHIAFTQEKRREGAAAVAKAAARVEKRECTLNEIAAIRFRSLATLLRFEENKRVTGSLLDKNILWHRYRGPSGSHSSPLLIDIEDEDQAGTSSSQHRDENDDDEDDGSEWQASRPTTPTRTQPALRVQPTNSPTKLDDAWMEEFL
ncbi:hypothetical protein EXIGLDRAFT_776517 [Exidia glandulosa HHB12029]|uniref:Uncharacterized protein n=1 Tax=Exidia glandulosa HHB12029 TaxID=1314781 RepID=A0A165DFR0_EXIGL|nr:hypothetical protein EXIGLDRAFT_776517 [Exidia glandulosa HHB12029]